MKNILKLIIPSILVFLLVYLGKQSKDFILTDIYILIPIIYIIAGLISKNIKLDLIITLVLLSIAFLIPINMWFHMGRCLDLVIIYNILSIIGYFIKTKIKQGLK